MRVVVPLNCFFVSYTDMAATEKAQAAEMAKTTSTTATKAEPYLTLRLPGKGREMKTFVTWIASPRHHVDAVPKGNSANKVAAEKDHRTDSADKIAPKLNARKIQPKWNHTAYMAVVCREKDADVKQREIKPTVAQREKDADVKQQETKPTVPEDEAAWIVVNNSFTWTRVADEQTSEGVAADPKSEAEAEAYVTVDPVTTTRKIPTLAPHTLRRLRGIVHDIQTGMSHDAVAAKYFGSNMRHLVGALALFAAVKDKEMCRLAGVGDVDGDGEWEMTTADDVEG